MRLEGTLTFVVDREGRIAGQGSLSEVLGIASGLPAIEDADR